MSARGDAPVARPAATVLLCRDGPSGVEVYLQRRPRRMGFAGGLWVYPGGRVDDADRDPAIDARWSGPSPVAWSERLDVAVDDARGYLVAACRELFEEAGVLLGTGSPSEGEAIAARRALLSGDRSFAKVLADLDVRIDTSLLRYWAWWVTPEAEPRRYGTRFFVARFPGDAVVTPHAEEVVEEIWAAAPIDGLMLPPTLHSLRALAAYGSTADVLHAAIDRTVTRVLPLIDGHDIVMPWGERHRRPAM